MSGNETLRVSEIFFSLQGETSRVGLPTAFVRLVGCPLRCAYCDTAHAFKGGETLTHAAILERVARHMPHHVTVTGGEPLAQAGCLSLLATLCDAGYAVSLETGGMLDISAVDARVAVVLDIKTPGSGEAAANHWDNIALLKPHDEVKFVLTDETDYQWACHVLELHDLARRCQVLFSPAADTLEPARLAEWILRDRLPVRFQLQLHKLLWGDARGR